MDTNETTSDETVEFPTEESFGKLIAKSFVLTTVTTAGAWAGVIAATAVAVKAADLWSKRKSSKETVESPDENN